MTRHLRASYYFLGALLARFKHAKVGMPGGCNFGVRPIDQHIKGFEALGASVTTGNAMVEVKAKEIVGNSVYFDMVSVGATVNVMLAAVKAKGLTVIENAAKEPHIVDLANFLNLMGADVRAQVRILSRFVAWTGCTAVSIPSSPTRLRRAPTWLPPQRQTVMCL